MNENTTQRLPQNIARIIKKIKKIKNKQPSPILLAGWWAGWSVGWLARLLVAVSKGILKESYTNPYETQPASQPAIHPPTQPAGQPTKRSPARRICGGRWYSLFSFCFSNAFEGFLGCRCLKGQKTYTRRSSTWSREPRSEPVLPELDSQ